MSDVDVVLERLVTDQVFRTQLRDDPVAALGGYHLGQEDLEILAASLEDDPGGEHGVEQRTSKSAILGALVLLSEGASTDVHAGTDGTQSSDHGMGSPYLKKACFDNTDEATDELVASGGPEAPDRPVIVGRMPNPPSAPAPEATDTPPSDGGHVEHVGSGWGVWDISDPANPEPTSGEPAPGPAGLRSDGELVQASDTRAAPGADATAQGVEGEADDDRLVAPQEQQPGFDAYLELDGVEGESTDAPPSQPEMVASESGLSDGQTERGAPGSAPAEAWSDHNDHDPGVRRGPEMTDLPHAPEDEAMPFLTYEFEKGAPGSPVVASWDQMLVSKYMPEDTPSPGDLADPAEGGAAPPPDEFTAPPGDGDASMTKSELTQRLARPPSGNDAPTDDLAPGDAAEEAVHPTYPGVYVEEVPSPETGAVPPDASLSSAEAEQHPSEGWPAKWSGPELPEETTPEGPQSDPPDLIGEPIGETDDGFLAKPDAPAEVEGNEVAIETVVIQNEGVHPEPDVSVDGDETETVAANRDVSVKGSKVKEN